MGFAEDKMWEYVKEHLDKIQELQLWDLLDHLSGCFTQPEIEGIRAKLTNDGNSRTAFFFMDSLRRRNDWVNAFIKALRRCKHSDIAEVYQTEYAKHQLPKKSQTNTPPPSRVPASPELLQSAPLPIGTCPPSYSPPDGSRIVFQGPAGCYQLPAYSPERTAQAPPSGTQPQPLPSQQAQNSSTATGATVPPFTPSEEDIFEVTQPPTQESQPASAKPNTNLTQTTNSAAMGARLDPHVTEAVSNPSRQDPKKGDFESRLSQEETDPHSNEMPTADDRSSFTPFNLTRRSIEFTPNTDRVVRRKELTGRNEAQNEPPDDRMGKVTEANTHQLYPSPTPAPSNIRNTPAKVLQSQIPRMVSQTRDPRDTSSPAKRETPARPLDPPDRIQVTRPSTHPGVPLRMDPRHGEEEEEQAPSKPGVLTADQTSNPAPQSSDSSSSSMRWSRLAISSDDSPPNESTLRRQQNEAHPGSVNENTTDYQQGRGGPSSSSEFTVGSDTLFIGPSSTASRPYENKEPEEVEFPEGSPSGRSTAEAHRDYLRDNNAVHRASPSRNLPFEYDGANSMEETGHYELKFSKNPSIQNDDTPNPVRSLNTVLSGDANSQGSVGNENRNNNKIMYQMVLPAIAAALVGVFLLYRSKQT